MKVRKQFKPSLRLGPNINDGAIYVEAGVGMRGTTFKGEIGLEWSLEWICIVAMVMALSRTEMPQLLHLPASVMDYNLLHKETPSFYIAFGHTTGNNYKSMLLNLRVSMKTILFLWDWRQRKKSLVEASSHKAESKTKACKRPRWGQLTLRLRLHHGTEVITSWELPCLLKQKGFLLTTI